MNWIRAFLAGVLSSALLMGVLDIFSMLGVTAFSYERYLGSLVLGTSHGTHVWTAGVVANWLVGGLFGLIYGFFFENVFRRSDVRLGTSLGLAHAVLAAVALFPFFGMLHQELRLERDFHFGFFGSGIDAATPMLLLFSHLIFGSAMGLFYGPVRSRRLEMKRFEPGEYGHPGEPGVILPDEDPWDSNVA